MGQLGHERSKWVQMGPKGSKIGVQNRGSKYKKKITTYSTFQIQPSTVYFGFFPSNNN
jgi:hypothetical protein